MHTCTHVYIQDVLVIFSEILLWYFAYCIDNVNTNIGIFANAFFHLTMRYVILQFVVYTLVNHDPKHIRQTSGIYSNTQIWVRYTWTNPRRSNYDAHTSRVCRRGGLVNTAIRIYRRTPLFAVYRYWPNFDAQSRERDRWGIFLTYRVAASDAFTRVNYNRLKQKLSFLIQENIDCMIWIYIFTVI